MSINSDSIINIYNIYKTYSTKLEISSFNLNYLSQNYFKSDNSVFYIDIPFIRNDNTNNYSNYQNCFEHLLSYDNRLCANCFKTDKYYNCYCNIKFCNECLLHNLELFRILVIISFNLLNKHLLNNNNYNYNIYITKNLDIFYTCFLCNNNLNICNICYLIDNINNFKYIFNKQYFHLNCFNIIIYLKTSKAIEDNNVCTIFENILSRVTEPIFSDIIEKEYALYKKNCINNNKNTLIEKLHVVNTYYMYRSTIYALLYIVDKELYKCKKDLHVYKECLFLNNNFNNILYNINNLMLKYLYNKEQLSSFFINNKHNIYCKIVNLNKKDIKIINNDYTYIKRNKIVVDNFNKIKDYEKCKCYIKAIKDFLLTQYSKNDSYIDLCKILSQTKNNLLQHKDNLFVSNNLNNNNNNKNYSTRSIINNTKLIKKNVNVSYIINNIKVFYFIYKNNNFLNFLFNKGGICYNLCENISTLNICNNYICFIPQEISNLCMNRNKYLCQYSNYYVNYKYSHLMVLYNKEHYLKVFKTNYCGYGLMALKYFNKNEFIIEYKGELIDQDSIDKRLKNIYKSNKDVSYIMKVATNYFIDSRFYGNISRFVNHSCSPNCEIQVYTSENRYIPYLVAIRNINLGEELTYDYKFSLFDKSKYIKCYCNQINCKKVIGN